MRGVLLDRWTGKARRAVRPLLGLSGLPVAHEENYRRGWRGSELGGEQPQPEDVLPDSILELLRKSAGLEGPFAGLASPFQPVADSSQYVRQRYWIVADTTLNTIAELIMMPAFNFYNSELNVGATIRTTLWGHLSLAITTPGTTTLRLRMGSVTGALQAASDAIIPTATQATTTASFKLEYLTTVRTIGAAATAWSEGRWLCPGTLETTPASTTIMVTHLKAQLIPSSASAIGAAFDSTSALGPVPTLQQTVSTYSAVTHLAAIELMN